MFWYRPLYRIVKTSLINNKNIVYWIIRLLKNQRQVAGTYNETVSESNWEYNMWIKSNKSSKDWCLKLAITDHF